MASLYAIVILISVFLVSGKILPAIRMAGKMLQTLQVSCHDACLTDLEGIVLCLTTRQWFSEPFPKVLPQNVTLHLDATVYADNQIYFM